MKNRRFAIAIWVLSIGLVSLLLGNTILLVRAVNWQASSTSQSQQEASMQLTERGFEDVQYVNDLDYGLGTSAPARMVFSAKFGSCHLTIERVQKTGELRLLDRYLAPNGQERVIEPFRGSYIGGALVNTGFLAWQSSTLGMQDCRHNAPSSATKKVVLLAIRN